MESSRKSWIKPGLKLDISKAQENRQFVDRKEELSGKSDNYCETCSKTNNMASRTGTKNLEIRYNITLIVYILD